MYNKTAERNRGNLASPPKFYFSKQTDNNNNKKTEANTKINQHTLFGDNGFLPLSFAYLCSLVFYFQNS